MSVVVQPKIAFISGHTDLTQQDFDRIYVPAINSALQDGHRIILGDAAGVDTMALTYLLSDIPLDKYAHVQQRITVFASRPNNIHKLKSLGVKVVGPKDPSLSTSDAVVAELAGVSSTGRDAARYRHLIRDTHMTLNSDYDILFVRTEDESRLLYGDKWRPRVSATELNRQRRVNVVARSLQS